MEGQQDNPTQQNNPTHERGKEQHKLSELAYGKKVFPHRFFASQHINKPAYL